MVWWVLVGCVERKGSWKRKEVEGAGVVQRIITTRGEDNSCKRRVAEGFVNFIFS